MAHSMIVVVYECLAQGKKYEELGRDYFDKIEREQLQARTVKKLEQLGFDVQVQPKAKAS